MEMIMTAETLLAQMGAGLRGLPPVEPARVDPTVHRLQWNESPLDFPPALKEEVARRMMDVDWARYPHSLRPFALCAAIARRLDVDPARVVVSGGSSDMIRVVLSALVAPGRAVVMPAPTFLLYRRTARLLDAAIHEQPCTPESGWALPVDALVERARAAGAAAVVLCAPNNPTGTVYAPADLACIAQQCGCALVIDEAYLEFSGQDLLPLALAYPNVVLIRTFSKAYRMAGVRVGYAIADPAVATELQKIVTSFPLSLFQEVVAAVALENAAAFAAGVAQVITERERLAAALAALPGVTVFPSGTNFLLVHTKTPAQALYAHLLNEHRVLVNDGGGYPELAGMLRISIGTPAESNLVIQGFREAILS
jgi:histidinol-phosphate aminotransferase